MYSSTIHRNTLLVVAASLLFSSCHKDKDPAPLTVVASSTATVSPTIVTLAYSSPPPTKANDPSFAFDFDNALVMPTPATAAPIPAPWAPTAPGAYTADIRNDHKQADGWELVYSTFSSSGSYSNQFFILYNQYRGLVRLYYYSPANANGTNLTGYQTLATALYLQGQQASSSPLLNFAAQAVVDITKNMSVASSLDMQPLAGSTWYVTQYELAYDPSLGNKSFTNTFATWQINNCQLIGLTLNGISQATLPVGLQADGIDFVRPGSNDRTLTYSGLAQLVLTGPASLRNLQQSGLPVEGARQVLALSAGAPWFRGQVPTQNAGLGALALLPIQARVAVRSDVSLTSILLSLPGYDNSLVTGTAPQYNAAPGVFYLQSPPVITKQVLATGVQPYVYTLNVASVKYLFNPAVQAVASIRNIQQEIVATAVGADLDGTLYAGTSLAASQELAIQGVRVSFDVVPKNSSAPVHIVKTFKADVQ